MNSNSIPIINRLIEKSDVSDTLFTIFFLSFHFLHFFLVTPLVKIQFWHSIGVLVEWSDHLSFPFLCWSKRQLEATREILLSPREMFGENRGKPGRANVDWWLEKREREDEKKVWVSHFMRWFSAPSKPNLSKPGSQYQIFNAHLMVQFFLWDSKKKFFFLKIFWWLGKNKKKKFFAFFSK